jgi:hypothetical protein
MPIRIDFIFSYWIFAWYIAFILHLTSYNPKWGLILGIIENLCMFIALLIFGGSPYYMILFMCINVVIKGIPLYTIYNTKTTQKDIYALLGLFAIYTIWVHLNGNTVIGYIKKTFYSILYGKNETPLMWIIKKFWQQN